jgi:hypothetical protein
MAPRRVIEDSDEDDGGFATPELLSPSMTTNEAGVIPMMQPSSTGKFECRCPSHQFWHRLNSIVIDPMLFRAVYEEHLGQLLVDDQLPSHGQSPVFEDPIIDQRMSSSASISSAQKLKRSKTINISSLSSITEPTLSNRKSKRTESTRGVDDLTQITTPRKSKDATRKDPWEVPTSSASDKPSDMDINVKIRSRNAERNNTLKTYGRRIRRTQTVGYTTHTTSNDRRLSSPLEDDITQVMNQNRSLQNQEDDDLPMPRPKRHKVGPSENVDLLEPVLTDPLNTTRKVRTQIIDCR